MFKIKGLDKLQRDLAAVQKALEAMDGELGTVQFDPNDPGSIEAAIQEVARIVDRKIDGYAGNPMVDKIADAIKAKYRDSILEKATAARLAGNDS
jgi:hypothetical protein